MLVETLQLLFNVILIVQVDITCLTSGSLKLLVAFREDTSEDPRFFGITSESHCDLASWAGRADKKPRKPCEWSVVSTLDCCVTGLDNNQPRGGAGGLVWIVQD